MKKLLLVLLFAFASPAPCLALTLQNQSLTVGGNTVQVQVPIGTRLEFVAPITNPAPRFLEVGPEGELLLGSKGASLYRVRLPFQGVETLVTLNGFLHSVAYRDGLLYAAETAGIWAAPYAGASAGLNSADFNKVVTLPSATGGHSSRTVITGPDNNLYVGIGISGNCSDEYLDNSYPFERRRGGVFQINSNFNLIPFSSGLRNPIGLAFNPATGRLYAGNAGPDNLGYDNPPEVFASLTQGSFHGMPWFQYDNGSFQSGECAQSPPPRPVDEAVIPAAVFDARSTPEGIAFLTRNIFGDEYLGSAVVAIHGSWATRPGAGQESRRPPKLALVVFSGSGPTGEVEDLVTGFQRADGSRFARPCGVAIGGDGNLYFTSDGGEVTGLFRLVRTLPPSPDKRVTTPLHLLLLSPAQQESGSSHE